MLKKVQQIILDTIFKSEIKTMAAWGGGTALSEIYLHHRKSDDIDIILSDLPEVTTLTILTNNIKEKIGAKSKKSIADMNRFQYFFEFAENDQQKLEFVYYPFIKLGKPKRIGNLIIESLFDIAVSKTLAGYQRREVKDAYDLYLVLKEKHFSLGNLIIGVEKKFSEKIDTGILLVNLTESLENFSALKPMLIKKVSKKEMSDFFQNVFNDFMKKKRL